MIQRLTCTLVKLYRSEVSRPRITPTLCTRRCSITTSAVKHAVTEGSIAPETPKDIPLFKTEEELREFERGKEVGSRLFDLSLTSPEKISEHRALLGIKLHTRYHVWTAFERGCIAGSYIAGAQKDDISDWYKINSKLAEKHFRESKVTRPISISYPYQQRRLILETARQHPNFTASEVLEKSGVSLPIQQCVRILKTAGYARTWAVESPLEHEEIKVARKPAPNFGPRRRSSNPFGGGTSYSSEDVRVLLELYRQHPTYSANLLRLKMNTKLSKDVLKKILAKHGIKRTSASVTQHHHERLSPAKPLTEDEQRLVVETVARNPQLTRKQVLEKTGLNIGMGTFERYLKKLGLRRRLRSTAEFQVNP